MAFYKWHVGRSAQENAGTVISSPQKNFLFQWYIRFFTLYMYNLFFFSFFFFNQSINTYARTPAVFARLNQNQIYISKTNTALCQTVVCRKMCPLGRWTSLSNKKVSRDISKYVVFSVFLCLKCLLVISFNLRNDFVGIPFGRKRDLSFSDMQTPGGDGDTFFVQQYKYVFSLCTYVRYGTVWYGTVRYGTVRWVFVCNDGDRGTPSSFSNTSTFSACLLRKLR